MTTRALTIPFGEWLPDLPDHSNPGALIAKNVIPEATSYRSLNALSSFTDALGSAALGAIWAQDENNVVFNFAGDSTALYELQSGSTWTDVSGTSAPYAAANWEFTKFGNRIIAASIADPLQKWDLGVDSAFQDLAGTPPQAARIATVRDFVMLGDVAGLGPNFVQWCGWNNSELWAPSLATQSDFQELFGRGGRVQRIVPGEYAIVFTEQSIFRFDYIGLPAIFQNDEVERKRGTPAPNSVIWTGSNVFYYGWDGFYHFDGQRSESISANRVSRWFEANAARDALDTMRGAVDRLNRLLIWAFRSSSSSVTNNRLIIYNWAADKWSYAELDTQLIEEFVSSGFSLDALDGPLPGGIDVDSILVDSTEFAGGALNIQAFDVNNKSASFNGMPLTGVLDTKEFGDPGGKRLVVNSVRPMIEASGNAVITVQSGTRNRLQDNSTFASPVTLNGINGEANLRQNARYHRERLNIAGGFNHGNGVQVHSRISGGRR